MFTRQYFGCLVVAGMFGFAPAAHADSFSCEGAWGDICASDTCSVGSIEEGTYNLGGGDRTSCHFYGVTCEKHNGQTQTSSLVETFDFLVQGLVNCNGELKDQNYCSNPVPPC